MKESRLFKILYYLLEHKDVTALELAKHLEVSVRTIYRDIDDISGAGIPVYTTQGRNGGVKILDGFTLDKSMFSEGEKEQILNGLATMLATNGKNSNELLYKLKSVFQIQSTSWIEVDFSGWFQQEVSEDMFNDLKKSILSRNIVSFNYLNSQGENIYRQVQPIKMIFKGKSWYMYGFCLVKSDYRFFKLTRIKNLAISEENFLPKKINPIVNKTIKQEETIKVTLKFDKHVAFRVYEEFGKEDITEKENSLYVTVLLPNNQTLYSYMLSFEEHVEIIKPKIIRENMILKIGKIKENYKI